MIKYVLIALMLFTSHGVFADTTSSEDGTISIENPWTRPTIPGTSVNGAYFVIKNNSAGDDRLISASSDSAETVEIHTHEHDNGVMKMREIEFAPVASNGQTNFEPGGLHIMLFDMRQPAKEGDEFALKLNFEKAGEIEVMVKVDNPD